MRRSDAGLGRPLAGVAIPIQNVGRGAAVIVRATLGGETSGRRQAQQGGVELVGKLRYSPIESALIGPDQSRVLAVAPEGGGVAIACASLSPEGGSLVAEVRYRALKLPTSGASREECGSRFRA
jgi:hypothetical protein